MIQKRYILLNLGLAIRGGIDLGLLLSRRDGGVRSFEGSQLSGFINGLDFITFATFGGRYLRNFPVLSTLDRLKTALSKYDNT